MPRIVTIALVACSLLAPNPWLKPAQPSSATDSAALAQALAAAWLPPPLATASWKSSSISVRE